MIKSVADLLSELKNKEVLKFSKFEDIKHTQTIGEMYEGLTIELMEKSIFADLNLRVLSGFIKNYKTGEISKQIDCMIVIGDGEQIPKTNDYIYDIEKVVAVFQVKKKLFSSDLSLAHDNLLSVGKLTAPAIIKMDLTKKTFEKMSGQRFPYNGDYSHLNENDEYFYHSLLVENYHPLRIIFAYDGFKTEETLREKFVEYLSDNLCKKGFGLVNLPSLILCGDNTLIKTNGLPYIYGKHEDNYIIYASYNKNPLVILLEILWTKLSNIFEDLPANIFDDNQKTEFLEPLMECKFSSKGLMVNCFNSKISCRSDDYIEDEAVVIDEIEFSIIYVLEQKCKCNINDEDLITYCKDKNIDVKDFVNKLHHKRIIAFNGNDFYLISNIIKIFKDNKCYIKKID